VTLENSKGSGDSIAKVDTGRADAGLADAAVVIASNARGTTVKTVGMVFDKNPHNVFSLKSKPLSQAQGPRRADARRPSGRQPAPDVPGLRQGERHRCRKVTWVNIEPAAKMAAVAEKRMDGVGDYSTGLPIYEKAAGKGNVVMMPWADFGFDMYSMSIIASAKTMKERPAVLKAFLEASYMGWRDVMADPEGRDGDLQEARARGRSSRPSPNMMIGVEPDEDRPLRQERHRLDRREEDVRFGRPGEHLHGPAQEGRLQGGLLDRVPAPRSRCRSRPSWRTGLIDLDRVGMTYRRRAARSRRSPASRCRRRRRVRLAGRAERLRQVHPAAHRGRPAAGHASAR
jgi:hypothetical protein